MSEEIKVQPVAASRGIADMRSSASAIPTTFAKEIKGENDLDAVREYNEIKQEYDDLLTKFENVFQQQLQATGEAVEKYEGGFCNPLNDKQNLLTESPNVF